MSDSGKSDPKNTFDIERLRPKDHDIDRTFTDMATGLKAKTDKDGQERFWGMKVSKTTAFAINSLYDQFVLPWTRSGAKQIYNGVLHAAEKFEATPGQAHNIASGVALAVRVGAVIGKPLAEFVSINREHFNERSDLYQQVKIAIDGTPTDYSKNEVIATAFDRVNGQWSRDLVRKVPDLVKVGIQGSMVYSEHQVDMNSKLGVATPSATPSAPVKTPAELEKDALDARLAELQDKGAPEWRINLEIDEYKMKRGMIKPASKDPNENVYGVLTPNLSGILGVTTELAKTAVDEYTEASVSHKETAWDKIQVLKRYMEQQAPNQNPDRLRINGQPLKKYIVEIFQQNEVDRGRGRMGEALVEQLAPAVNMIADSIADTTLDVNALVHLVGDHKVIIQQGTARIFANEENVQQALDSLKGVNTSKEKIDKQEFFSAFADPATAQEVVRKNVASLDGDEKALFVSVFPDEILTHAGMTKEAITSERKRAHAFIYDVVLADTLELSRKAPEELKKLGLSKDEIKSIQELAEEVERGNKGAVNVAVDGSDRTVISAIRTAALHKQIEERGEDAERVWTELVHKGSSLHEKLENGELRKHQHKGFAEREEHHAAGEGHSEREIKRRSSHDDKPHEGLGAV